MKIFNDYNEEEMIDRTWYDSSNIIYSECYDKPDSLKEVKIVFSSGRCYLYKDVNVNDYLMFREAKSQGKAINRFLTKNENGKPVYEFVRLEDVDVDKIRKSMQEYDSVPKLLIDNDGNLRIVVNRNVVYENKSGLLGNEDVKLLLIDIFDTLNLNYKLKEIETNEIY